MRGAGGAFPQGCCGSPRAEGGLERVRQRDLSPERIDPPCSFLLGQSRLELRRLVRLLRQALQLGGLRLGHHLSTPKNFGSVEQLLP